MAVLRRKSRRIMIGSVSVGGGAPVSIQSMTNTDTRDAAATLKQIRELAEAGCEIIRVALPDLAAADAVPEIVSASPIPVVADIHFDHRIALRAIANGIHALRLNPGNIDSRERVCEVAEAAGERNIPIRVGANSGSVKAERLQALRAAGVNANEAMARALTESALEQCHMLEEFGFRSIKLSIKSSSVPVTVEATRLAADSCDYPLHLGITEAGTPQRGIVKSSVGLGAMLLMGLGDTIRVSLTANPVQEVYAAQRILESCELRSAQPEIVSCPTCGRTEIDLIGLAEKVGDYVDSLRRSGCTIDLKKIAVMGCVVNGPGEARDADLGLAGGKNKVVLFRFGEVLGTYGEAEGLARLKEEIRSRTLVPKTE